MTKPMTEPMTERRLANIRNLCDAAGVDPMQIVDHVPDLLAEVERLRAEIGLVEPAEYPNEGFVSNATQQCECCGMPIRPGDDVAVFREDDETTGAVSVTYAHWGPCPSPDLWAAQCADHDGQWYPIYRADALPDEVPVVGPYEYAWLDAMGSVLSAGDMLGGVRLVRVRKVDGHV